MWMNTQKLICSNSFFVVVVVFCADNANKSLPVKFGRMIFLFCLQSSTNFVQLSFSQHVHSFRFLNLKSKSKSFMYLHTVFLFGTRQPWSKY